MEKMKKVLMVGFTSPQEGGSERHIFEISQRINSTALTQKGSLCKNKIELPITHYSTFLRNIFFALFSSIYLLYLLIKPRKEYALIHLHENLLYYLTPILRLRFKVVVTIHGINGFKFYDNQLLRIIFLNPLKFANQIIAVNKEDKKTLKSYFKKLAYLPNGVDLSIYQKIDSKMEKKITFIGRIHRQKGIIYLLKAFSNLNKKYPQFRLEIIGEINEYAKELQKEFINKNIIWRGYISDRKEIVKSLKSSYCIVLPSLWEGLPLTLFESLASGRPLIVSDIPAFKSVIKDEAIFFKNQNANDLEDKLEYSIKNSQKMKTIGIRGKKLSEIYDWDSIASKLKKIYQEQ